ncbi:MAG TPA: metalloregulator ArsR/SmtB family transcription factor [Euzebya sp.]|nr:metalloregulator ArsR/SmtB family transcription factor [Euzebya sp.]
MQATQAFHHGRSTRDDIGTAVLSDQQAQTYASWFTTLSDATRVRVLHTVASQGPLTVGELARRTGVSQPTCSHHVKLLAEAGFVRTHRRGTSTEVSVNHACCSGLPHAADVVMGALDTLPCCPADVPTDVVVRPMEVGDVDAVRRIYAEGIATGLATFETAVPLWPDLDRRWLPDQRFVARADGAVAGWAALAPISPRTCSAGVAETSVYVGEAFRGRRVGVALIDRQVREADRAGLWTLQASIFPENTASLRLHRSAGFRTIGVRDRIARDGDAWRDTVLVERRRQEDPATDGACIGC